MSIMLDIQQKRKVRAFMYNRVTLGALFLLVLLALHSTWVVYDKKTSSEEMREVVQKQVSELRDRDGDLQGKIDKLATVSGIEEEIRSKFSVAKNDESMVVVVPDENKSTTTQTKKKGFWDKIKSLF